MMLSVWYQRVFDAQGPQSGRIGALMWFIIIVSAIVYVIVMAALAFAIRRGRHRAAVGELADQQPATERRLTRSIVAATGVSDEVIASLIKAVKAKDETIGKAEGVAAVAGQLPKEKFFVSYIAVDNIITTAMKYAAAFGANMPLNLPPNQPPVGVSVASEGTAIRVDTFVPTQLVKSVTAAVIQLQMQMQGGGMGGGM